MIGSNYLLLWKQSYIPTNIQNHEQHEVAWPEGSVKRCSENRCTEKFWKTPKRSNLDESLFFYVQKRLFKLYSKRTPTRMFSRVLSESFLSDFSLKIKRLAGQKLLMQNVPKW